MYLPPTRALRACLAAAVLSPVAVTAAVTPAAASTTYTAPGVPIDLRTGHDKVACDEEAPGRSLSRTNNLLTAHFTDADGSPDTPEFITARFAIWPVDAPDQRRELEIPSVGVPRDASVVIPDDLMVHGRTYAWQAQGADGEDTSPWSAPCYFTVDIVAPATAPTVSSVDYPENEWGGGAGIPGVFTFSANGDTDIVAFRYGTGSGQTYDVAADRAGGEASVTITPSSAGPYTLAVRGVDSAGNVGVERRYDFFVEDTAPIVTGPRSVTVGEPAEFTFAPGMADVTEYEYWFTGEQPTTVAAGSDGTARVTIVRPVSVYVLNVRSRTSSGLLSSVYYTLFIVEQP